MHLRSQLLGKEAKKHTYTIHLCSLISLNKMLIEKDANRNLRIGEIKKIDLVKIILAF